MLSFRLAIFAALAACLTFLAFCPPADAGIFFDRGGGCPSCQQCQGATCPAPVPPVAIPPVPAAAVAKITPPAAVQAAAHEPATMPQTQAYATERRFQPLKRARAACATINENRPKLFARRQ